MDTTTKERTMKEYECLNPTCPMVGHIDKRKVCLGCKQPKKEVRNEA